MKPSAFKEYVLGPGLMDSKTGLDPRLVWTSFKDWTRFDGKQDWFRPATRAGFVMKEKRNRQNNTNAH